MHAVIHGNAGGMAVLQATAAAKASDLQTAIASAFASSQSSVSSTGALLPVSVITHHKFRIEPYSGGAQSDLDRGGRVTSQKHHGILEC